MLNNIMWINFIFLLRQINESCSSTHGGIKVEFRILTQVQNKMEKESDIHIQGRLLVLVSYCSFCSHSRIFFLHCLQGLSRISTQEQLLAALFSWTNFAWIFKNLTTL